jgi:hypothetical protein
VQGTSAAEMEPDFSTVGGPSFEFAFNEANFSDRELRIEVVAGDYDAPGSTGGGAGGGGLADWARHRKRRREELFKEKGMPTESGYACRCCLAIVRFCVLICHARCDSAENLLGSWVPRFFGVKSDFRWYTTI